MNRLFPNPPKKWTQDKYRIIVWQEDNKKRRQKPEETRLSKEDFMRKWGKDKGEDDKPAGGN